MIRAYQNEYFGRLEFSAYAETEEKAKRMLYHAMLKYAKRFDIYLDKDTKRAMKEDVWVEEVSIGHVYIDGDVFE